MIDVRKLEMWRRADLEALVFAKQGQQPGDIAGDIPMMKLRKSIRFSIQQYDEGIGGSFISLSAQGQTRCTDKDVRTFLSHIKIKTAVELASRTPGTIVRTFKVSPYDA